MSAMRNEPSPAPDAGSNTTAASAGVAVTRHCVLEITSTRLASGSFSSNTNPSLTIRT